MSDALNTDIILRAARTADVPALAALTASAYQHAFAHILAPETLAACDAACFTPRLAESWERVSVIESGGTIAGFTKITGAHLDMLFVAPEQIGGGLGVQLLIHAEAQGIATLETFRDNHAARRFYERHGWVMTRSYTRDFMGATFAFCWYEKVVPCPPDV